MKPFAAAPALLAILLVSQAQAGLQYKVQTTVEGGSRGGPGNSAMQLTADGEKARMEFTQGGPMKAGEGFLLTQDGGKTMLMVSTKEKSYMKWDMEAMMGMVGAMSAMMKMEVTDPKVEKLLDEPGTPILGYPTRHYKFRISYGMSMNMGMFSSSSTISREEETWTTTKIDTAALGRWFKGAPKTMNESLDALIKSEQNKMKGLPLRMITVATTTDNKGKTSTTKSTMEVTEIKELKPAAALFEIPEGYTEATMPAGEESEPASRKSGKPGKKDGAPQLPDFLKMLNK